MNVNVQTQVKLNRFKPRHYQIPLMDAILNKGYKRVLAILPRRAGKDVTAFNTVVRCAINQIGNYWLVYPTYSSGRKIIWDSITNEGLRFINYIPEELIEKTNSQEMKIYLKNGSLIQVIGSDNYDSLVGTNARGIVFSEYALQDPRAYQFLRPVLTANDGFAIFISTPRGRNHLYNLWEIAQANPEQWFSYKMTVEETKHIPLELIEHELRSGEMSEDLIQQEYYCCFSRGVRGSYYAKYIDKMRINGQIGDVPWEPAFKVHVALDIGFRDSTSLIFYQVIGHSVKIIDCYEKNKEGLEHYVKIIESKPYSYGRYIGPHDLRQHEFSSGVTRFEKARQLGITFTIADNIPIPDGIEAVRSTLSKVWIDESRCAPLIKSLENYRQEWDDRLQDYKSGPLHNWASHFADAMRYLCVSLPKTRDGLTPEDLDRRYNEAMYGSSSNLPSVFRDDLPFQGY